MTIARRHILTFLIVVLLLIYSPALFGSYGHMDDYYLLFSFIKGGGGPGARAWIFTQRMAFGRPAEFFVTWLSYGFLKSIAQLRYVRLSGIVALIGLAWLLQRRLAQSGWDSDQSTLLAVIICTMPPFQVFAAWAATSQYAIAALLSAASFELSDVALDSLYQLRGLALVTAAVLLEVISLTINQMLGLVFVVPAAIQLFSKGGEWSHAVGRFLKNQATLLTSLLIAFVIERIGDRLYGAALRYRGSPDTGRLGLDLHVVAKAVWFLKWPLMNALNLCYLPPSSYLAMAAALAIAIGLFLYFKGSVLKRLSDLRCGCRAIAVELRAGADQC